MQSINERLKLLRKNHLCITQNELGDSIGIKGSTISDIEKGKAGLTERNLIAICEIFNVNEDWLRTGDGEIFKQLNRKEELKLAIEKILTNEKNSFKERLLNVLINSNESELEALENFAIKIVKDKFNNLSDKLKLSNTEEIIYQENKLSSEQFNKCLKHTQYEDNLLDKFNKLNDVGMQEAIKRVDELTYFDKYTNSSVNASKLEKIENKEEKTELVTLVAYGGNGVEGRYYTKEQLEKLKELIKRDEAKDK